MFFSLFRLKPRPKNHRRGTVLFGERGTWKKSTNVTCATSATRTPVTCGSTCRFTLESTATTVTCAARDSTRLRTTSITWTGTWVCSTSVNCARRPTSPNTRTSNIFCVTWTRKNKLWLERKWINLPALDVACIPAGLVERREIGPKAVRLRESFCAHVVEKTYQSKKIRWICSTGGINGTSWNCAPNERNSLFACKTLVRIKFAFQRLHVSFFPDVLRS